MGFLELFPLGLQQLLNELHEELEVERQTLLAARRDRQNRYNKGQLPHYLTEGPAKSEPWMVAPIPADLLDRRVEITGPISSPKMVINMLSENQDGDIANTAMLDFEDSMAPTWENVLQGLRNIIGVAKKDLSVITAEKTYKLNPDRMALPMVRVRGLHLNENHFSIGHQEISASLFDLAATAFHTAKLFLADGKTPKFYVPKCEHYLEARWWNKAFQKIERYLDLPKGTLRVTFLIETLPAAFQMEEILYEIRERACGLNGGRWDKIFSDIKTLQMNPNFIMANRSYIDMTKPWMENYAKLLIKTCHKHGAFAMGGMSAFTPGKDATTRHIQTEKVIADKKREASIGHDGCWVSHPYFIGVAKKQFTQKNQLNILLNSFPSHPDLLPNADGPKTMDGLRQNVRVGIAYQQGWDQGIGCVAFENLMEDLATLEISRAQVWQWLHHQVKLDDQTLVTSDLVNKLFDEECETIFGSMPEISASEKETYLKAKDKIRKIFLAKNLSDFFTTQNTN